MALRHPLPLVNAAELFIRGFSLNGLGASFDMRVDGGSIPQDFRVVVPAGHLLLLRTIALHLVDATIRPQDFGGINGGVSNGLLMHIHDVHDEALVDLVQDSPIRSNYELAHLGAPYYYVPAAGVGVLHVECDLRNLCGMEPYLTAGQYVALHVRDDLQALTHFEAFVGGRLIAL